MTQRKLTPLATQRHNLLKPSLVPSEWRWSDADHHHLFRQSPLNVWTCLCNERSTANPRRLHKLPQFLPLNQCLHGGRKPHDDLTQEDSSRDTPTLFQISQHCETLLYRTIESLSFKEKQLEYPIAKYTKDEKQKDVEAKNNNRKENCRDAPTSSKKQLEYPIVETKGEKQIDANVRNHNRKEITVERSLQPIICVGVNE